MSYRPCASAFFFSSFILLSCGRSQHSLNGQRKNASLFFSLLVNRCWWRWLGYIINRRGIFSDERR